MLSSFDNPYCVDAPSTAARIVGVGLLAAGGAVLAPVALVGGLSFLGFTATGVAGGGFPSFSFLPLSVF